MNDAIKMQAFAVRKTQELIDNSVFALHDALRLHDAETVHRMRVAIRRLQQALRVFSQFLDKSGVKRVRKQLKRCLRAAGQLRDHDITIQLLEKSGQDVTGLRSGRTACKRALRTTLRQVTSKDIGVKWRNELGLTS
jgi:CHAD domain-containing protein